ncbi:uncharacterized protein LTHEOB_9668 [Lasiodiplodia theobromae]|uniref:uncharacterized protein n=1 Tax=Lasiodiplodia theobromae TaxID=45133 RepID=UPI0015C2D553|nr:uncharacterized protein LTHEOB_9668 [Lasiodiplodia theobromae]KAF4539856.1 hypothetical protein LTHEOB_9668 [Lasiodiplodia theobromae]
MSDVEQDKHTHNTTEDVEEIPQDRALVEKGPPVALKPNFRAFDQVSIPIEKNGVVKPGVLVVHQARQAGRSWEYQLKDSKGNLFKGGAWIPQKESPPPEYSETVEQAESRTDDARETLSQRLLGLFKSEKLPDEITETEVRSLEGSQPGYPHLATLKCEQSFMLYRGFSWVHARLIMDLQAKIAYLEKELDELDKSEAVDPDTERRLCWVEEDMDGHKRAAASERTRQKIFEELRGLVLEYDELLIKAKKLASFQRPSDRDYYSVRNFHYRFGPLVEDDEEYIKHREDLISLKAGREWAGFDGFVENTVFKLSKIFPKIKNIFCDDDLRRRTDSGRTKVHFLSPGRIEAFVSLIITVVIFVLLIIPVFAMYRLASFRDTKDIFAAIGWVVEAIVRTFM